MELADLIDLEWQLQADIRGGDPAVPRRRDRDWGPAIQSEVQTALAGRNGERSFGLRHALVEDREVRALVCAGWLKRLRQQPDGDGLPGRQWQAALRWTTGLLVLLGALLGWATASEVLAYDGTVPVNVLGFIGVFMVLQIVLLATLLWVLFRRRRGGGLGFVPRLVGVIAQSAWLNRLVGGRARSAASAAGDLGSVRGLYGDLGTWALFRSTQWCGVAFNGVALVTCLLTVALTDLVFSWSTTLDVSAAQFHAVIQTLGAPWAWVPGLADTVPSREVVEQSRWVRMEGAFVGGGGPQQTAPWWRFLVIGLVVYGLVPRLLALGLGHWRLRRNLAAAALDHGGFQRLYERLLAGSGPWAGPAPDSVRGPGPVPDGASGIGRAQVADGQGQERVLLCWGRLGQHGERVEALWRDRGVRPAAVEAVGGADLDQDRVALERLRSAGTRWVTLVFDFDHQPTKEVLGFLRQLRTAVTPDTCITVQLVVDPGDGPLTAAADSEQWTAWDRSLRTVGDPYLWLEGMES